MAATDHGVQEKDLESASASSRQTPTGEDYTVPTAEEQATLRKIAGGIPPIAYLICVVELAERASYYGAKGVFSNYMQFPLPKGGNGTGAVPKNNPNGHAGAL